jgi:asparagine synthase (glutamine-hydrolysing)
MNLAPTNPMASVANSTTSVIGRPRLDGREADAALLVRQIQEHGIEAVLQRLDGDFALALGLPDGRLLLAVDRFAIGTVCWRAAEGRVLHDPRADVLAAAQGGLPEAGIRWQALLDYLHFHAIPAPGTVFEGVHRLPPAHYALCQGGQVQVKRYWVPAFREQQGADLAALSAEFRRLVRVGVERQLDGSTPACFLSGGTDSSTVAGMIREITGRGAEAYSIGFEAEGYDEMAYARIAARRFDCRHHEYYVTPQDLVDSIPAAAAFHDQPFGNSSVVPALHCARQAASQGVTRLLAGDGGDELFGGNARYAKQRVFGWYAHLPAAARSSMLEPLLLGTPLGRLPLLRKAASYAEQARRPLPGRLDLYNLLWRVGVAEVLDPGFLALVDTAEPARLQQAVWDETPGPCSELNRNLAFDWRFTLADNDLPKVRLATQQAGMGVGFPLLDRDLLDFSLALPSTLKLKGSQLRWFFKESLRGFLPDEILVKKKHGFGLPFGVWAVRHPGLQALSRDSLHALGERGVVRPAFVARLMSELLPAHPGYYGELVWILMMLEQWLRRARPQLRLR